MQKQEQLYTLSEVAQRLGQTEGRKTYDKVRAYCRFHGAEPLKVGPEGYKTRLFTERDIAKITRAMGDK